MDFPVFSSVILRGWMTRLRRLGYWPCGARIDQWKKKHGGDYGGGGDDDVDGAGDVSSISRWDCRSSRHRRHLRAPEREGTVGFARWAGIRSVAGSHGTNS